MIVKHILLTLWEFCYFQKNSPLTCAHIRLSKICTCREELALFLIDWFSVNLIIARHAYITSWTGLKLLPVQIRFKDHRSKLVHSTQTYPLRDTFTSPDKLAWNYYPSRICPSDYWLLLSSIRGSILESYTHEISSLLPPYFNHIFILPLKNSIEMLFLTKLLIKICSFLRCLWKNVKNVCRFWNKDFSNTHP